MSELTPARPATWLTEPLSDDVAQSIDKLCLADDVARVAVMPDVHLANDVCIGVVVATRALVYPAAVGGDIGCGMAAVALDVEAAAMDNERSAAKLLAGLYQRVPANKHRQPRDLPETLQHLPLSDGRLQKIATRDGRVQFGTLGRGNHFVELQSDQKSRLWAMVHSGSRAMGQAIAAHHLQAAVASRGGLTHLDAEQESGKLYLADVEWARTYARENRLAMLRAVEQLFGELFNVAVDWPSLIHADHNHVARETHGGVSYWVHRKGAQAAAEGEPGIVPGSMGAVSFHTVGRGCDEALRSCSHGAGRKLSRTEARRQVSGKDLARQVGRLWYDHRRASSLRDEAPAAYRDIHAVMRAQRDLTKIVRELRPVLNYKG